MPTGRSTAGPRSRESRLDWRIWLLAIGTFAIGTDAFVIAGILPAIARGLRISPASAGQIVTAYSVTYAVGSPILAALAARMSRRLVVRLALLLFAVANALSAFTTSYELLMLTRVLAGAAAALYTPTAYALAASVAPAARRGAALAAVALGLTGATVVGVPIGVAIGTQVGWQATFWLIAALAVGAAAALSMRPLPGGDDLSTPSSGLRTRLAPLTRGRTMVSLLPSYLWSTASMMVYTYISIILLDAGYTTSSVIYLLVGYGSGALVGNQLGGRLGDRFGWRRPIVLGLLILIVVQLLIPFLVRDPIAATILLLLWSICGWATWAPQQSRLMAYEPGAENVILALGNSTVYLASASGAALGGLVISRFEPLALPIIAAALSSLALLTFALGERANRARAWVLTRPS